MSDEIVATPKKRGRPPGRKRKDPSDSPIDGHYKRDALLNREAGKRYALLDNEDAQEFKHRGYRKVERSEDGVRPLWGQDTSEAGSGYQVKGLTLFECEEARAQKYDDESRSMSEGRMNAIHLKAQQTGGYMTREVNRS